MTTRMWAWAAGRRGRGRQILVWAIILIIVVRVSAPLILTHITNAALADGKTVRGSITGVSLGLLTGNYTVHGLELRIQRKSGAWVPLLEISSIRCDLEMLPLLRGDLVGHGIISRPVLHVLAPLGEPAPQPTSEKKTPPPETDQVANPPWQEPIRTVIRARLTSVKIIDGQVLYTDERHAITAAITDIAAEVDDLVIPKQVLTHRCPCRLTAQMPGNGFLSMNGEVDIMSRMPIFLAHTQLEHVDLVALNPLTKPFGNLNFRSGDFSGYAELVADGRNLGGYIKVIFHDLDIGRFGEAGDGKATTAFLGLLVGIGEVVLENTEKHQHAARIPIRGPLTDPNTDVWTALATALSNAFIHALAPGFERPDPVAMVPTAP